jgi:hypothetical protein
VLNERVERELGVFLLLAGLALEVTPKVVAAEFFSTRVTCSLVIFIEFL